MYMVKKINRKNEFFVFIFVPFLIYIYTIIPKIYMYLKANMCKYVCIVCTLLCTKCRCMFDIQNKTVFQLTKVSIVPIFLFFAYMCMYVHLHMYVQCI